MEKEKKKLSVKSKVIITISVILAVLIVFNFAFGYILNSVLLRTDSFITRDDITAMLRKNTGISTQFFGLNADTIEWFNVNRKQKEITSSDGLKLIGSYFENENNDHRYAVVCHGYSGRGRQMVGFAQEFLKRNFAVLCPDSRAHGMSAGTVIGMGEFEQHDLILWINEIIKQDPEAEIVLMGVSMGAATVLMTSGLEELPENVKVIVSDCAYTSAYDEFRSQITDIMHLPPFPLVNIAGMFSELRDGCNFKETSPLDAVKKSKTPTLFIHGDADAFVPYPMMDELYNAAACEKEKLSVKDGAHGNSAGTDPELYWSTVENFVGRYIDMGL